MRKGKYPQSHLGSVEIPDKTALFESLRPVFPA
jgi:hypothetical protein